MEYAELHPYGGVSPKALGAFIAQTATVIGDVEIGDGSSIWFGVVARGDVNKIRIGARTNIQDGSLLHGSSRGQGVYVGDEVTVGHMAVIHACTVEDRAFIGTKACLLDNVRVESNAWVAAGALVTPGTVVKSGELWAGVPATYLRPVNDEERQEVLDNAERYLNLALEYLKLQQIDDDN